MLRSVRPLRLVPAAALLLAVSLAPGCGGAYPLDGGGTSGDILLTDLDPKLLPIALDEDADPKDVLYKSRANYKPKTALDGKKDKRLMLKAKKDDAALRAVLEQTLFGTQATIHGRVGFDPAKTNGLVDGTSQVFLEYVLDTSPPLDGGPTSTRILEAVYDEASGGLRVQATDGTGPLGTPHLFEGSSEVVLQFRDDGFTLFLEAAVPTGAFYFSFGAPTVIHSEPLPGADGIPTPRTVAWGVGGLGKQGTMFLNQLLIGGSVPGIGPVETPIAEDLNDAWELALHASPQFGPSLAQATTDMETLAGTLQTVIADIEAALGASDGGGGGFASVTQGELSLKSAQKALKLVEKAAAQGNKLLDKGKTNNLPVSKKANKAVPVIQLALAQLAGFKSKSKGKVDKMGDVVSW